MNRLSTRTTSTFDVDYFRYEVNPWFRPSAPSSLAPQEYRFIFRTSNFLNKNLGKFSLLNWPFSSLNIFVIMPFTCRFKNSPWSFWKRRILMTLPYNSVDLNFKIIEYKSPCIAVNSSNKCWEYFKLEVIADVRSFKTGNRYKELTEFSFNWINYLLKRLSPDDSTAI